MTNILVHDDIPSLVFWKFAWVFVTEEVVTTGENKMQV